MFTILIFVSSFKDQQVHVYVSFQSLHMGIVVNAPPFGGEGSLSLDQSPSRKPKSPLFTNFSQNLFYFAVEKVIKQNLPHRKVAKREISLIETSKGWQLCIEPWCARLTVSAKTASSPSVCIWCQYFSWLLRPSHILILSRAGTSNFLSLIALSPGYYW